MAALDEAIVRVVETLDATGRLENTSIFVMSDNGLMMGQHRLFCAKGVPYDQAIRIPLLAWGPGFKGKSTVRLASNIDIAPTIAELAGVRFDTADGKSLLRNTARDYVLLQTSPHSLTFGGFGLRSSQLMYFEQASGESEYYDLRTDPLETNNLLPPSGPPGHIPMDLPRPEELSARLATLKVCAGGNCA